MTQQLIQHDAVKAFDVIVNGGIGILPMDIGYSLIGGSSDALIRIFNAKGRAIGKLNALVGDLTLADELLNLTPQARELLHLLTVTYDLPLGAIAPCDMNHPLIKTLDHRTRAMSVKDKTIVLLVNAGPFHAAISRLSYESKHLLIGSSANLSNAGTKFKVTDIEPEILDIADIIVDHGLRKYHLYQKSSTLLNLDTLGVVRHGACFDLIADVVKRHYGVRLAGPNPD
ncbi:MAG: Sua5/YciO/YrdC/YwlC family protein [Arenicellales bacterium]|nr:Sua5/YciO/YrdC/YwlC family protein [Arenicellales bacterium]